MDQEKNVDTGSIRLQDVARLAGVSIATVSNVLNRKHSVAASTRRRVERIIEQFDYQPNEHAVALRRKPPIAHPDSETVAAKAQTDRSPSSPDQSQEHASPPGVPPVGTRIQVVLRGVMIEGGVDASMPDGSGFWFWQDGVGRRYVSRVENPELFNALGAAAKDT
jgi:transcriptional regulator with XRE-family HTH domain